MNKNGRKVDHERVVRDLAIHSCLLELVKHAVQLAYRRDPFPDDCCDHQPEILAGYLALFLLVSSVKPFGVRSANVTFVFFNRFKIFSRAVPSR